MMWTNGPFISPVLVWENLETTHCSTFQCSQKLNRELSKVYNKLPEVQQQDKTLQPVIDSSLAHTKEWSFINTFENSGKLNMIMEVKFLPDVFIA